MGREIGHVYQFDDFRLDPAERQLLRDGAPVALTPKVFETLVALVERRGRLVEKEELMKLVWADAFVEEANLARAVHTLRKALGEEHNGHKHIETVPKRGYRFVADVTELPGARSVAETPLRPRAIAPEAEQIMTPVAGVPGDAPSPSADGEVKPGRGGLRIRAASALLLGLSAVVALAALYRPWAAREAQSVKAGAAGGQPIRSIAVLPFKTIGEGDNEYLGLGMSDALITKLGNSRQLAVRQTSAIRRYTDPKQDPVAAGKQQGVDAVLDGSVQRVGGRMRATVHLVRVADGAVLWSGQFDESFTDIFAVQDSISQRVIRELVVELTPAERERLERRGTRNVEAYQAYLKGRYFWNKRSRDGFEKAVAHFNQAIALDPDYAPAYAGLGDTYQFLASYDVGSRTESYAKSRAAARRALELDETLAEAHASLGLLAMNFDWDWATAEREFKRAIELNPNYATAHHWYSEYLNMQGRPEESLAEIGRARELDPLSLIINTDMGKALYLARRYDEAINQLLRTLELDPNFFEARFYLARAYQAKGLHEQALAQYEKARELSDDQLWARAGVASVYGLQGRKDEARKILNEVKQLSKQNRIDPQVITNIYIGLGEKDQAFAWFEKLYETRSVGLTSLKVYPIYDSLRPDPRFADLMRRVGLR